MDNGHSWAFMNCQNNINDLDVPKIRKFILKFPILPSLQTYLPAPSKDSQKVAKKTFHHYCKYGMVDYL
jgi:hypothetical protein